MSAVTVAIAAVDATVDVMAAGVVAIAVRADIADSTIRDASTIRDVSTIHDPPVRPAGLGSPT
jgi:hypothetical protein